MTAKERLALVAVEVEQEGEKLIAASARLRAAAQGLSEAEACRYLARLIASRMVAPDSLPESFDVPSKPSVNS